MTDRRKPERMQHLIITRFAVRFPEHPAPSPEWIEERFDLLERYTAPSMRNQTVGDFEWWLQCDVATDQAVVDRLRAVAPQVRVALVGADPGDGRAIATADARGWSARAHVRPGTTILVQTRLDSDDVLHPAYLADLEAELPLFLAHGDVEWLRIAATGYQYDSRSREIQSRFYCDGSFQSYYCRVGPDLPARPMPSNHSRTASKVWGYAPEVRPSWIRIIHGGNVMNRMDPSLPSADVDAVGREFRLDL